jgi:hypothetical protein
VAPSRSSVLPRRDAPARFGCETPRVFTPPLRRLTVETSAGFSVIEFAEQVAKVDLLPWQRWLLIHALELLPDGSFRFRNVVVLVARQNGKSKLSQILALWFMFVYGIAVVLGTAQDLDTAEEVWQGAVDLVEETDEDDEPVRPEMHALLDKVVLVNGKKSLNLKTGERYKVKAANRRAGRGLSGDLILMDELREHQSWDAWGAITKTTMARANAQVWSLSNAGDRTSIVLDYLRKIGHAALGDPDGICTEAAADVPDDVEDIASEADDLGIFEWSAAPGCSIADRDGWAQANPSMGHPGMITERAVSSAMRTDPDAVFRTEVLCQWVERITASAIDSVSWAALADPDAARGSEPVFAVATAPDRSWSAVAVAWRRPDGAAQVMLADYRPQTGWVQARVDELRARWRSPVLVDTASHGLVEGAVKPSLGEQAVAHNALSDAVLAATVRHGNEPAMNMAVRSARWKPSGDTRILDRKGSADIAPLVAAALAVHGLGAARASIYEERGMVVLG